MKNENRRINSNYIYKIRQEDDKRMIDSGSYIPNGPSLFSEKITGDNSHTRRSMDSSPRS